MLAKGTAAPMRSNKVARSQERFREIGQHAIVTAPKAPDRVAIAIVPLGKARRKIAELIAAGADVPGLGDQFFRAQHRVLADGIEETAMFGSNP